MHDVDKAAELVQHTGKQAVHSMHKPSRLIEP